MATEPRDIIAYFEGSNAFDDGQPITLNFYDEGTAEHSEFSRGWNYQSNDKEPRG
jgi:hypothetical protein